jgi:hypothetical protein
MEANKFASFGGIHTIVQTSYLVISFKYFKEIINFSYSQLNIVWKFFFYEIYNQ